MVLPTAGVLLLLFISLVSAGESIISFSPYCTRGSNSTETCGNSLSGIVYLSGNEYTTTIQQVWDDSIQQPINLERPIYLNFKVLQNQVGWRLKNVGYFYNVYEGYEYDVGCSINPGVGLCYANDTRPPTDGSESHVLCCLNGRRGTGSHCLRYDYSQKYLIYETVEYLVIVIVQVTIGNGSDMQTFNVSVTDNDVSIANFSEVLMMNTGNMQVNYFPVSLDLSAASTISNSTYSNWFILPQTDKLNMTAYEWQMETTCSGMQNDATATHTHLDHIKDQYYVYKTEYKLTGIGLTENGFGVSSNIDNSIITMRSNSDATISLMFSIENVK